MTIPPYYFAPTRSVDGPVSEALSGLNQHWASMQRRRLRGDRGFCEVRGVKLAALVARGPKRGQALGWNECIVV